MKSFFSVIGVLATIVVAVIIVREFQEKNNYIKQNPTTSSNMTSKLEEEGQVPTVVSKQMEKERIRQNTNWTAENQALYSKEYCLAKLEETEKMGRSLENLAYKLALTRKTNERKQKEAEVNLQKMEVFLKTMKQLYRQAEAKNLWPVELNGCKLERQQLEKRIVEANERVLQYKANKDGCILAERKLMRKAEHVFATQQRLVKTRAQIQSTLETLQLKVVIEGEDGILDALEAINDSMGALVVESEEESLEDLMRQPEAVEHKAAFEKIMSEE